MHPSAGGPPVVVENFVRESRKLGHSSAIVSSEMFCHGDEQLLLERLSALAPTTLLPRSIASAFLNSAARRRLSENIQGADIVHVHTLWNPINLAVRSECIRHQKPYVLMPHGMLDPYSLSVRRWRKALYFRAIERKNILSANRLIFTTAEEARLATTQLSPIPGHSVIPLGGDAPDEDRDNLALQFFSQFPKAMNRLQILFLGRLHIKKGLDRILTALPAIVQAFPDVLLTVVGDGSPAFRAMITKMIEARNLKEKVLMTGRLEGSAKWGAYATAQMFLLPSRQENFAITVAEAMQMGLPVVVSDKVNTWPYVKEAEAGLVLEESRIQTELEEGIISLLADLERSKRMGRRGRDYARKHLTWAQATKQLVNCYDHVLGYSRGGYPNGWTHCR